MIIRKWGWWLILLVFSLLIGVGVFLYEQPKDRLDYIEPEVLTLTTSTVASVELEQLFKQLKEDHFTIKVVQIPLEEGLEFTTKTCPADTRIYKGSGVREYHMQGSVRIAKFGEEGYPTGLEYPEFSLQVLEFEQASEAERQAKWLEKRERGWDEHCLISMTTSVPEKIVVNGTRVYIVSAWTEILRGFTEKYSNQLKEK